MGLDMYLTEEVYISRYDHMQNDSARKEEYHRAEVILKAAKLVMPDNNGLYVRATVVYWRKANAIHNWFVANVQAGKDDCEQHDVGVEQLTTLVALCREVLAKVKMESGIIINGYHMGPDTDGEWKPNIEDGDVVANPEIAHELLPTSEGFFFGSTAYNEWYVRTLMDTIVLVDAALTNAADDFPDFAYRSSW